MPVTTQIFRDRRIRWQYCGIWFVTNHGRKHIGSWGGFFWRIRRIRRVVPDGVGLGLGTVGE